MKEIVTIQVGDFANYIGSHFCNFQDELLGLAEDDGADSIFKNNCMDMDVLYRTGQTHQGTYTYCPRLISIGSQDKGNQGNVLNRFHALSPEIGDDSEDLYMAESLVFNGALYSGVHRASISQVKDSIFRVYDKGLRAKPKSSHLSISLTPIPIPLSFPSIFPTSTGRHGETLVDQLEVESVPIVTRLRSSIAIKPFIEGRYNNLLRHGMARGAKGAGVLRDWGFWKDEVDEIGEHLSKMGAMLLNPKLYKGAGLKFT